MSFLTLLKKVATQKKLSAFLFTIVFLSGVLTFFAPASVNAALQDSPSQFNLFDVTTAEENMMYAGCNMSTAGGLIGNLMKSLNGVVSVREDMIRCDICEENGGECPDNTYQKYFEKKANQAVEGNAQAPGLLGLVTTANDMLLQQRPASGTEYIEQKVYALSHPWQSVSADVNENPTYYRPGTGYSLLRPIQGFWGWAVNVVYGLLILIIIFVAFAIMFKARLPGSASITLQNAIPSIALAMIMVPLSYAISGLFIDAMAIGSNAVHEFLIGSGSPGRVVYESRNENGGETSSDRGLYIDDKRVEWFQVIVTKDYSAQGVVVGEGLGNIVDNPLMTVVQSILDLFADETPEAKAQAGGNENLAWFGTIVNFIISLFMLYTGLKIFWHLLKKYLIFLLMPIFAPFIFATMAIPGNGTKNIMTYARTLGAASLAYIVTYAMYLLMLIFSSVAFMETIPNLGTSSFIPPMLGIGGLALSKLSEETGGRVDALTALIFALISMGIYFSIPNALKGIDRALRVQEALPSFLTTPFSEFKENIKFTTRTAPAAGLEAIRITGRRIGQIREARRNWDTAGLRGIKAYRNIMDRRKGLTPGEAGTWEAERASDLAKQLTEADDRITAAKRAYAAAKAQGRTDLMDAAVRDLKKAQVDRSRVEGIAEKQGIKARPEKPEEAPKLDVKFEWVGQVFNSQNPGIINLADEEINGYLTDSKGGSIKVKSSLYIVISAQNFQVPVPLSLEVANVTVATELTGDQFFDPNNIIGIIEPTSLRRVKGDINHPFEFTTPKSAAGVIDLELVSGDSGSPYSPTGGGKDIRIKANLELLNTQKIFKGTATEPPLVDATHRVLSTKIAFRVGNAMSKPLFLIIQKAKTGG